MIANEHITIDSNSYDKVKARGSIKASAKEKVGVLETNRNKPWFDQECSELANKRKQANYFGYKIQTTKL
jgi:hypothetical protein